MDVLVDEFYKNQKIDGQSAAVPGFFVRSTAPVNIEEDECKTDETLPTIYDVVECLYQNRRKNPSYTGLVIQIHGYNTGVKTKTFDPKEVSAENFDYTNIQNGKLVGVTDYIYQNWKRVLQEINQKDSAIYRNPNSFVYLGYRWPSESIPSSLNDAIKALPFLLRVLFGAGTAIAVVGLLLTVWIASAVFDALFVLLAAIGVALVALVGSFFLLRVIVYFRDAYRANNFGVPDLVEFIRQLDQGLLQRTINEDFFNQVSQRVGQTHTADPDLLAKAVRKTWEQIRTKTELFQNQNNQQFLALLTNIRHGDLAQFDDDVFLSIYDSFLTIDPPDYDKKYSEAQNYWNKDQGKKRIRLTFVGHSMGGFVTTQAVRVLSDVFDPNSIGTVNSADSVNKRPPASLGSVFCLGRLILVSPDIPVKAIISGRTNFLRSSLRRFEEAYLFSNEGDLALRIASTAANYFSFPASSRTQGYRLGNVSVNLKDRNTYGVVNLDKLFKDKTDQLLQYICVEVFRRTDRGLEPKAEARKDTNAIAVTQKDPESIADLFTYLDCTEYRDKTDYPKRDGKLMNVLICDQQQSPLNLRSYTALLKAYIDFSGDQQTGIDVHGGYFYGHFSKRLIYRLAFLGFGGFLDTLVSEVPATFNIESPDSELRQDLDKIDQLSQEDRRKTALKYFSWICQQKLIQVAVSPERYCVDVLGIARSDVRTKILTRESKPAIDS